MIAVRPDWMLVDGSSLIFRAFYGVPSTTRAPDGRQINAVRGFLETLTRLVSSRRPGCLAIASDHDWRPQRRVDLIPSYKAHRTAEPIPPGLIPQVPLIEDLLAAIGIEYVGRSELEAEDVIASWVEQLDGRIQIVSGDRDLFSLVRDPDVIVLYPEKGGLAEVDEAEVERRYDIPGSLYADFAVLRGDPSDGLPGLSGVGAKTAASLVRKYNGLDGLLASGTLSEAASNYVIRAREVVTPGAAVPVPIPTNRPSTFPADAEAAEKLSADLRLKSVVENLVQALNANQGYES